MGCRRVTKSGSWTEYIDFGGQTLAEKNSNGTWSDYIFANGTRLAKAGSVNALTPSSSTTYYHSDQIGSTRMQTDGAGNVVSTNDFYPYGQGPQPTSQNHYLFSGKERDQESGGLDYFGARYYLGAIGRFMSADWSAQADPIPYAKLDDPQTLNLYAYVRNNPISLVDPDGHQTPNDGFVWPWYHPTAGNWGNMGDNELIKAITATNEVRQPRGIANPIKDFFQRVRNLFSGMGFKTNEQLNGVVKTVQGAGLVAPRGNPQFNAGQGAVNQPRPETPAPALKPPQPEPGIDIPGPGEIPIPGPDATPADWLRYNTAKFLEGVGSLADEAKDFSKSPIVCITCTIKQGEMRHYQQTANPGLD